MNSKHRLQGERSCPRIYIYQSSQRLLCGYLGTPTSLFHPVQAQPPCSFHPKPYSTSCTAESRISIHLKEAHPYILSRALLSSPWVCHSYMQVIRQFSSVLLPHLGHPFLVSGGASWILLVDSEGVDACCINREVVNMPSFPCSFKTK